MQADSTSDAIQQPQALPIFQQSQGELFYSKIVGTHLNSVNSQNITLI